MDITSEQGSRFSALLPSIAQSVSDAWDASYDRAGYESMGIGDSQMIAIDIAFCRSMTLPPSEGGTLTAHAAERVEFWAPARINGPTPVSRPPSRPMGETGGLLEAVRLNSRISQLGPDRSRDAASRDGPIGLLEAARLNSSRPRDAAARDH